MADFEIKRSSETKQVPLSSLDDNYSNDVITASRGNPRPDPFFSAAEKPNLGMEFLVDESDEEEERDDNSQASGSDDQFLNQPEENEPITMTHEEIQQEKAQCLSQLKRFEGRGIVVSRRFGMEHSLNDIKGEVYRIKKENQVDAGINYCRQGLMFCVSTIEMANENFNVGGKLDGWSNIVLNSIDDYDDVFEELYEKYYSNMGASPEIKLMSMLAGSAFMFHLQKSMTIPSGKQREMAGPSDEMLRSLNDDDDDNDDDTNSTSGSVASSVKVKNINIQPEKKGRGRPKKLNK
jgi:hypothetical protein